MYEVAVFLRRTGSEVGGHNKYNDYRGCRNDLALYDGLYDLLHKSYSNALIEH